MEIDLVTKEDLVKFRTELLEELKAVFAVDKSPKKKKWVKGKIVREMLEMSYGSLQNLRTSGQVTYTKVRGTYYYLQEDVNRLFELKVKRAWK